MPQRNRVLQSDFHCIRDSMAAPYPSRLWRKPCARGLVALVVATVLLMEPSVLAAQGAQAPKPAAPPPAGAQQTQNPPPPPEDLDGARGRIRSRVDLVVVPVTVKDNTGKLVLDLVKEDFRILEDDVEQQIELFSAEPFPLSAVLLIDNSLSKKVSEQVQNSIAAIAGGMSAADEAAVVLFDELTSGETGFLKDNDELFKHLTRLKLGGEFTVRAGGPMTSGPKINSIPQPGAGSMPTNTTKSARLPKHIDDAVFAAAQLLREAPRDRRKIIFLISDGANAKNNTYKFEDVSRALLAAGISVYSIGVGDVKFDRGPRIPGLALDNVLARYARATGGDVFYGGSRESLEKLYSQVTEQARLQYTLGYASKGTDARREYHDIDVRVKRSGLDILARQGYYRPTP